MAEYIEREALRLGIFNTMWRDSEDVDIAYDMAESIPSADVVEVKHGRWVWKHRHHGGFRKYTGVDEFGETHTITVDERSECDEPYCPYCGKWNESVFRNFCPNCGARMDGE